MKPFRATVICTLATALLTAGCAGNKKEEAPPTAAQAAASLGTTLAGDDLFAFGKSGIADISSGGRERLDALATQLQSTPYGLVRVVGFTDRIGSDKANMALSTRRAHAVRDYLVERGIPMERIVATGRGRYQPVVACETERGQALIDCLAPNRRVEITVDPPFDR